MDTPGHLGHGSRGTDWIVLLGFVASSFKHSVGTEHWSNLGTERSYPKCLSVVFDGFWLHPRCFFSKSLLPQVPCFWLLVARLPDRKWHLRQASISASVANLAYLGFSELVGLGKYSSCFYQWKHLLPFSVFCLVFLQCVGLSLLSHQMVEEVLNILQQV